LVARNQSEDLAYLGCYEDTLGQLKYWYKIADHKVSVDCIKNLELLEDESDSI